MKTKVLILNEFDLTLRDGIYLDLELCKLFGVECYPVVTKIVSGGKALLNVKAEEIIKQLEVLDLSNVNTIKLNAAMSVSIINYIKERLSMSRLEVKALTLSADVLSECLTYERLKRLSINDLISASSILFITSDIAEYLSKVLGISSESVHDLIKSLSNTLNIDVVVLLNHKVMCGGFVNLIYHAGNCLEFKDQVELPKEVVATYITLGLASKAELKDLVNSALKFARMSVDYGVRCRTYLIPDVYGVTVLDAEKFKVINELANAVRIIEENSHLIIDLIPEVQMNLAYSLPKRFVRGLNDVAAVPGRIVKVGNVVKATSQPEFGASKHLAKALIKVMEYDPKIRSVANIRFDDLILKAIEKLGYTTSFYDRSLEPPEVKSVEGATIPWGVGEAIKRVGFVPDVIYHRGDYGKEAMIAVLGENPSNVVNKLLSIGKTLKELGLQSN